MKWIVFFALAAWAAWWYFCKSDDSSAAVANTTKKGCNCGCGGDPAANQPAVAEGYPEPMSPPDGKLDLSTQPFTANVLKFAHESPVFGDEGVAVAEEDTYE